MLTAKQIEKIANSEWNIALKRRHHPLRHKGWYLPDEKEIRIYLPEHENETDLAITILHELIHVRNGRREDNARESKTKYNKIEREARETYRKKPELLDFIKQLYSLDY